MGRGDAASSLAALGSASVLAIALDAVHEPRPPDGGARHGRRRGVGHRRHGGRADGRRPARAFMQYLRVLVGVAATPVLMPLASRAPRRDAGRRRRHVRRRRAARHPSAIAGPGGHPRRARTRLPAGSLLGADAPRRRRRPARCPTGSTVPTRAAARGGVRRDRAAGRPALHVGDRARGRRAAACRSWRRIVGLMVACFGLAVVLDLTSLGDAAGRLSRHARRGGRYAVLAAAFGSGADTTFVLAVQTLRRAGRWCSLAARGRDRARVRTSARRVPRLGRPCPGPWS